MTNDSVKKLKIGKLNESIRVSQRHQIYLNKVMTAYLYEVHIRVESLGDRIAELAQELFLGGGMIMMGMVRMVAVMMVMTTEVMSLSCVRVGLREREGESGKIGFYILVG